MRIFLKCCAAIAFYTIVSPLVAQETEPTDSSDTHEANESRFVPAAFVDQPNSLEGLVRFPDVEGDVDVVLLCGAMVSDRAAITINICFGPNNDYAAFENAFEEAMPELRATAAYLNGRRRTVWLPYSVVFIRRGTNELVRLYPNYGRETSRYGRLYTAPQRLFGRARNIESACRLNGTARIMWVRADITADGKVQNIEIPSEGSRRCKATIRSVLEGSSFIPAHYEGNPVSAEFLEPFFDNL